MGENNKTTKIAVIVLGVIVIAGFLYLNARDNKPEPLVVQPPAPMEQAENEQKIVEEITYVAPPVSWKTYTDSKYGFSISHPKDWVAAVADYPSIYSVSFSSKAVDEENKRLLREGAEREGVAPELQIEVTTPASYSGDNTEDLDASLTLVDGQAPARVLFMGKPGFLTYDDGMLGGIFYYTEDNGELYIVRISDDVAGESAGLRLPEVRKIISTFKFIK